MPKRLLFLTQYDENGASSRIRVYQFLPYFHRAGFDITVRPLIQEDANKLFAALANANNLVRGHSVLFRLASAYGKRLGHILSAFRYDVVVVQKDVLPFGLGILLGLLHQNIIFECDDPIWLPNPSFHTKRWLRNLVTAYRRRLFKKNGPASESSYR